MARTKSKTKRRTTTRKRATRKKKGTDTLTNFFVPLVLMIAIVGCLSVLLYMGFRTVSASSFFDVKEVEVSGNNRISNKRIETIINKYTANGVWKTDLEQIRTELERISYVRHASISRVLPSTIKVSIEERRPVAVARIGEEYFEIDADARILGNAPSGGKRGKMFVMIGWDEGIDQKANDDNKERVNLYRQLQSEWAQYDLANRVAAVDLSSTRNVEAFIIDSGERVVLSLGNEDFVDRLKEGIKHARGQGKRVSKIELNSTSPVIVYRDRD